MDLSQVKLQNSEDFLNLIEHEQVKRFAENEIQFWKRNSSHEMGKKWLKTCENFKDKVKILDHKIPELISPKSTNISLIDIKVI